MFKQAKVSGSPASWKAALRARAAERKVWEYQRLVRASEGDWTTFKELRPRRQQGWEHHFADVQQRDPHWVVHNHLENVYQGPPNPEIQKSDDVRPFESEELRGALGELRRGKSVGRS